MNVVGHPVRVHGLSGRGEQELNELPEGRWCRLPRATYVGMGHPRAEFHGLVGIGMLDQPVSGRNALHALVLPLNTLTVFFLTCMQRPSDCTGAAPP